MPTRENLVKRKIKEVLDKFPSVYRFMPVQFGYGNRTLDYLLCVNGRFCAIEAKAPGKEPRPLQLACIHRIRTAGGRVFVIDGTDETDTIEQLEEWIRYAIHTNSARWPKDEGIS